VTPLKSIYRYSLRRQRVQLHDQSAVYGRPPIASSRDISGILHAILGHEPCEVFVLLCLNCKLNVIGYAEIARGGLDQVAVVPGEIIRVAIASGATAFIVAHNHPSGDPAPSSQDDIFTNKLQQACALVGLTLLDHVIVGEDQTYSYRNTGHFTKV